MKLKLTLFCLFTILINSEPYCQKQFVTINDSVDYISALKDTLYSLSENSDNAFFRMHCNSMISLINSKKFFTGMDSSFLKKTYNAFNNNTDASNPKKLSSYLKRNRRFILSWVSPTDSVVSLSWLRPPENWDPEKVYPLYIQLHGDWEVASDIIQYMTYPFISEAATDSSFNDGYLLEPWGRGDLWAEGNTIPDFWECITALEKIAKTDPTRKYLSGHSMGGYEALLIASLSPNVWAALGIHSGAIGYPKRYVINMTTADTLKDVPTYFVLGTYEDQQLTNNNQKMYQMFVDAGNPNIKWVTFNDAHVYIEENVENMYLWMRNFVNSDPSTEIKLPGKTSKSGFSVRSYPNPVITNAHVLFTVPANAKVNIYVCDIFGRNIKNLMNESKIPGEYEVAFDATEFKAGLYIIRLKTGDFVIDSKIIVAR